MVIYFYSKIESHGYLSNFSPHEFELGGRVWATVEHYFQAMKFSDGGYVELIRAAKTPGSAKALGRSRDFPIRQDWDAARIEIMRQAVTAKFRAHDDLREQLLETGDEELVEKAPRDYFWGCGAKGTGQNMLGKILMEVRSQLRAES